MSRPVMPTSEQHQCSPFSLAQQVAVAASAGFRSDQLVMELAEPWASAYAASADFPSGVSELSKEFAKRTGRPLQFNGVAPDPAYSRAGERWLSYLRLTPGGRYEQQSYQVPEGTLLALLRHITLGEGGADEFAAFREASAGKRDILVCGHASRDGCCGRWGRELYTYLRARPYLEEAGLRVWCSTHIGGHRFAPTMFELPSMRYWGHLSPQAAEAVLRRQGDTAVLLPHYRGFAGLNATPAQLVEGALLAREGWAFLAADNLTITEDGADAARLVATYELPGGQRRERAARVVELEPKEAYGSCGDAEMMTVRQYSCVLEA